MDAWERTERQAFAALQSKKPFDSDVFGEFKHGVEVLARSREVLRRTPQREAIPPAGRLILPPAEGAVLNRFGKCADQKRQPTPTVVSEVFKPCPYGLTSLL